MKIEGWLKNFSYCKHSVSIFSQERNHITHVKGWGKLQHCFESLSDVGQFIADAINEKIKRDYE